MPFVSRSAFADAAQRVGQELQPSPDDLRREVVTTLAVDPDVGAGLEALERVFHMVDGTCLDA